MNYVLPGMGADHHMYSGAWHHLADTQFLDWPSDAKEESLSAIAARVAEDASIVDGATLIGSSLGGMVACEIAKIRKLDRLILIGSARRKEEVSSLLHLLHPLIDLAPLSFVQAACGKLPSDICSMFSQSDAEFIRCMCRAIFQWDGLPQDVVELSRIHGRFDLVIPPPTEATLLDGGHLIAMTHPIECVQFITEANQSPQTRATSGPV